MVILGAPARMTREFDDLLIYLRNPRELKVPLLLLAHERTADVAGFLLARPDTQFLLWSNFSRIPALIRQAVGAHSAAKAPADVRGGDRPKAEISLGEPAPQAPRQAPAPASPPSRPAPVARPTPAPVAAPATVETPIKASTGHYDLFVLDYFLPDGNGDELCRRLREVPKYRETPIAMITSTYREDIIRKSLDAGALECTFKNEAKELFLARIGSLARQITMRKQMLGEKQRLGDILGSVGDGVYGVDASGRLSFINPTALRLLGHDDETALIGMNAHEAIHHSDDSGGNLPEADSRLAQAYRSGESLNRIEALFFDRDHRPVPVECSVHVLMLHGQRDGTVVVFRDISERKSADRLKWELSHDPLTGLHNARHFNQALSSELAKRREQGGYSAVLYIDIDRFTHIVDSAGGDAADQLLIEYGQLIGKRLRDGDVLSRLEADRLALLLTNVQLDNLFTVADSFRELARQTNYRMNRTRRHATASVGVAVLSRDTPSSEYVVEHARVACKSAKHRGRDQTQIYVGEHDVRVARELEAGWISRFRDALDENRFEFAAQPIVPILDVAEATEEPDGAWRLGNRQHEILFELLIRMRERKGEYVSPAVFVPLAERVGMMSKIDLWGVRHVLRRPRREERVRRWQDCVQHQSVEPDPRRH
ncbi:MAG: diguanylate cyclase [Ahniella sp.]|nr:diguanylate cyclase [Ahniella sp.]